MKLGELILDHRLALVRATHLNDYISVLREIGAPVDRELDKSKLPSRIEDSLDLYVSIPDAVEWVARAGRDLEAMELGLLGARRASLTALPPAAQTAIFSAQTGLMRLEAMARISKIEDSALEMSVRQEGDSVRVVCDMTHISRHPFIGFAEWLNLQGVISVVRSVAGPSWCPSEMGFVSSGHVPHAACAAFPDTRILVGQASSSVVVKQTELALPTEEAQKSTDDRLATPGIRLEQAEGWEFVSLLRRMIQPYLNEGATNVAFAAEMAGISTRTLQRLLKTSGTTYSRTLQEARFELSRELLDDPDARIIDIAMLAGYNCPQHFSRAFRRFTGVTPTRYRLSIAGGGKSADAQGY